MAGEAVATAPDPATSARAEAICRRATSEAQPLIGNLARTIGRSSSPEEGIDKGLVRPGIRILEKQGAALAALHPDPESAVFSTYVGLFEPVLSLAYQRLEAGESLDYGAAHELELLIGNLTGEQVKLAASIGLTECETSFFEALGTAQ